LETLIKVRFADYARALRFTVTPSNRVEQPRRCQLSAEIRCREPSKVHESLAGVRVATVILIVEASIAFVGPRNARAIELNASDCVMGLAIFDG
jgi:hypothetical protein